MTVELKDKLYKKKEKEAKKAEKRLAKQAKKEEKTIKKEAELINSSETYRKLVDHRIKVDELKKEYHKEIELRGEDLSTWPIEVVEKYKTIAPYEMYGISFENASEHRDYTFDPTQGFKPIVEPEPELIKPFSFIDNLNNKIEKPKKDPVMPDAVFMELELIFGKYLVDQKYRYECYNGIYKLFIARIGGVEEEYIIDNGTILGGSNYSILANTNNDTMFVFVDDPEIPEVLRSKFYVITDECIKRNSERLFERGIIYRYIDFSNTSWLYDKDIDRKVLETKLFGITQITSNNGESPRMRFNKFESVDSFELISDEFVKSPLADINATSSIIIPGLKVKIEGDNATIYNNEIPTAKYIMTVSRS